MSTFRKEPKSPVRPEAGISENWSLVYMGIEKNADDSEIPGRAIIQFEDDKGRKFPHRFFAPKEGQDWAYEKNHKVLGHLVSAVLTDAKTEELMDKAINIKTDFEAYVNMISKAIIAASNGVKFRLKLLYITNAKGTFLNLAISDYSNYIENMTVNPTTLFMSAKDMEKAKRPAPTPVDQNDGSEGSTGTEDLPF